MTDQIKEFLVNNPGEFTAKEIADAIKAKGVDYLNYYTEGQVAWELKSIGRGIADVKFIHSRETADFGRSFAYEAWKFEKGATSNRLHFEIKNVETGS